MVQSFQNGKAHPWELRALAAQFCYSYEVCHLLTNGRGDANAEIGARGYYAHWPRNFVMAIRLATYSPMGGVTSM